METVSSSQKRLFIIGGVIVVILLVIVVTIMSVQQQNQKKAAALIKTPSASLKTSLAYQPPAGAHFTALGDINFLPKRINGYILNKESLLPGVQLASPVSATEDDYVTTANKTIFSWLALNDYYTSFEPDKVSALYKKNLNLTDFTAINKDYNRQITDYSSKDIKLSGYYALVRFSGVRSENVAKLQKKQSDLDPLARSIIETYHSQALNPTLRDGVLGSLNNDAQAKLLNNDLPSQSFADRELYPPLVSDPNYYVWVQRLLVGQVSDIMTLQQYNFQKKAQENYAYVFFYISKKSGNHIPVNVLTDQFISKATIQ